MNSTTVVEHSVALDAEQKPIWCYSGIDLYVSLQIDSTESTRVDNLSPWASLDAPRPAQLYSHTLAAPPADVVARILDNGERSKQRQISREDSAERSRIVEEPNCPHLAPGPGEFDKLDGEVLRRGWRALAQMRGEQICGQGEQNYGQGKRSGRVEARRSLPGVAVRRFIARFVAPSAVQKDEPRCLHNSAQTSSGDRQSQEYAWNDQAEERSDERSSEEDHEKVCDLKGQCRQSKYEFSPRCGNVVKGCRRTINDDLGELGGSSHEDLEDQPKHQTRREEAFNSCNENRNWSPEVEDYSWVPVDMSRDLDNRLTGCTEDSTDIGDELDKDCPNMPSSFISEKDGVGQMLQLEHSGNACLDTLIPSKFPNIESFDVAEILAACQLVKMSAFDCQNDFSEQDMSGMTGHDVNHLEYRGESNEDRLSKIVETVYGSLTNIDFGNSMNASQPAVGKLDLSPWSDEDRYIPRIARRARGRLRGSQFSTRIDFGNTEVDGDSDNDNDYEVLQRLPRKRQYKYTQELLLAFRDNVQ